MKYDDPKEDMTAGKEERRESPAAYDNAQKKLYTLDDYYALPEERRAELIDGIIYEMSSPSWNHQAILLALAVQFGKCMEEHHASCRVAAAPCDVRLDRDDFTMVQPDLMVICDEKKITERCVEGAPDLTLEILSPSTRSKDMVLKLYKYRKAGVREYWTVDPEYRKITVHLFEDGDDEPSEYGFDDRIPVGISGGKCTIDFSEVKKHIL